MSSGVFCASAFETHVADIILADDTYSWIPSTFAGQGYGDLFFQPGGQDTPLVRKAAYDGVVAGLTNTTVTV